MKTAISLPDDLFARIERRVEIERMTRSEFFAKAAERYLVELERADLTERMNAAIEAGGAEAQREQLEMAEFSRRAMARLLKDDEW